MNTDTARTFPSPAAELLRRVRADQRRTDRGLSIRSTLRGTTKTLDRAYQTAVLAAPRNARPAGPLPPLVTLLGRERGWSWQAAVDLQTAAGYQW